MNIFDLIKQHGFDYELDKESYLLKLLSDRWNLTFFWCNNQVSYIAYKKVYNSLIFNKTMIDLIYKISNEITDKGKEFWNI